MGLDRRRLVVLIFACEVDTHIWIGYRPGDRYLVDPTEQKFFVYITLFSALIPPVNLTIRISTPYTEWISQRFLSRSSPGSWRWLL